MKNLKVNSKVLLLSVGIIIATTFGVTISLVANEKNLAGKELTVQTDVAIACFTTGWLEKVITCAKVGDWLKECMGDNLEEELFKPISSAVSAPRCLKLLKGDKVKVVDVDSQKHNFLWVEIETNKSLKWWTLQEFFKPLE